MKKKGSRDLRSQVAMVLVLLYYYNSKNKKRGKPKKKKYGEKSMEKKVREKKSTRKKYGIKKSTGKKYGKKRTGKSGHAQNILPKKVRETEKRAGPPPPQLPVAHARSLPPPLRVM